MTAPGFQLLSASLVLFAASHLHRASAPLLDAHEQPALLRRSLAAEELKDEAERKIRALQASRFKTAFFFFLKKILLLIIIITIIVVIIMIIVPIIILIIRTILA